MNPDDLFRPPNGSAYVTDEVPILRHVKGTCLLGGVP